MGRYLNHWRGWQLRLGQDLTVHGHHPRVELALGGDHVYG